MTFSITVAGGQFALAAKSLYPRSTTYVTDMNDERLLDAFRPLNNQIRFEDFPASDLRFDAIFLNDVFEHLTFPRETLETLRHKLKPGGFVFIDTPCTFWLYPVTRTIAPKIHRKLLRGTVDFDHQQIWTTRSFHTIARKTGFEVRKYLRLSEFTQPPEFYMRNMGIRNRLVWLAGILFYRHARYIARNKIQAVLVPAPA